MIFDYEKVMLQIFSRCLFWLNLAAGLSIFLLSFAGQAIQSENMAAEAVCVSCFNASRPSAKEPPNQAGKSIQESLLHCPKIYQSGEASFYGEDDGLDGRTTASGEPLDSTAMTAAHKKLPIGTWIQVRNLQTNEKVYVRINDRGPYHKKRILDLSAAAAAKISLDKDKGTTRVQIRICKPKPVD